VRCWGDNTNDQLGHALAKKDFKGSYRPVTVDGVSGVIGVNAGYFQTCALVKDDKVYCWGRNSLNQLGGGSTKPDHSITPIEVKFLP
jgi:alpha-tubulin suppressor-like RCC1 family protein